MSEWMPNNYLHSHRQSLKHTISFIPRRHRSCHEDHLETTGSYCALMGRVEFSCNLGGSFPHVPPLLSSQLPEIGDQLILFAGEGREKSDGLSRVWGEEKGLVSLS